MRLDQYLSKLGIIKRRTVAKEMADGGMIKVNNRRAKPSADVNTGDIVSVGGNRQITIEIKNIPAGNVKKEERENYYNKLD